MVQGDARELKVLVNMNAGTEGKGVGLRLAGKGVQTSAEGLILEGSDMYLSYSGHAPTGIVIDGLFSDWDAVMNLLSVDDIDAES